MRREAAHYSAAQSPARVRTAARRTWASALDPRSSTINRPQLSALNPQPSTRRGFTLVELLMVIVIIALLIGLLLPAINGAVIRAREARVSSDLGALNSAIADFKSQFGFEPPSSVILFEEAAGWTTTTNNAQLDALQRETRSVLRRMFPQMDFANPDGDNNPGADLNGDGNVNADPDGDNNPGLLLNGAECLVFFLGGLQDPTQSGGGAPALMLGFSKNPRAPFSRVSGNRVGPFYSGFDAGRLVDINANRMPELVDPLPEQQSPYWYMSSNDGRGYDTPAANGGNPTPDVTSGGQIAIFDVYRQSPPVAASGNTPANPGTAYNPKSYQIISPGYDGQYGTGGYFDEDNTNGSLGTKPLNFPTTTARASEAERDNITNFRTSRLAP